jgi:hypothetical protein
MKKGFFEGLGGAGEPSGSVAGAERPCIKAAKADGVSEAASAGGGRPVIFAINVLNHLIIVKIPKADPRVFRKFPNCSATETMALEKLAISKEACTNERTYQKKSYESPYMCSPASEQTHQMHPQYSQSSER